MVQVGVVVLEERVGQGKLQIAAQEVQVVQAAAQVTAPLVFFEQQMDLR